MQKLDSNAIIYADNPNRIQQASKKINEIIDWINNQEKVPAQTLNPPKEGLIKNMEDVLINARRNIRQGLSINAEERIDKALQYLNELANGETPVEDNTVGSKYVRNSILYNLRNHTKEAWPKDSIGETKILNQLMYIFNQFKPVETTKEQPVWKIDCKYKNRHSKAPAKTFIGSAKELAKYINDYYCHDTIITDFQQIG